MEPQVFLVDEDVDVRETLAWLFRSRGMTCRSFDSAEGFIAFATSPEYPWGKPSCLVLDVRLRGISGLELFDRLRDRGALSQLPVIFQTAHGDVATAVEVLKKGAFDFFEKPVNHLQLIERVNAAHRQAGEALAKTQSVVSVRERLDTLTERERQVMTLILEGKYNKVIADQLGISMRTVEVHRARIFSKMGVRTAVELANRLKVLESESSSLL